MSVEHVVILGAGTMGSGIAQVCAQVGLRATLVDTAEPALARARQSIAWSVGKLVEKGALKDGADAVMARIVTTTELAPASTADLVLEAVSEQRALKLDVIARAAALAPPQTLIASNTSALSITELAVASQRPDRFLGLHFFNPVPLLQAVEVVRGMLTSDETMAAGQRFVEQLGKQPILVQHDVPGFLVNRINLPSSVEAMRLVEQGVATVEDVDLAMKLATGRKMGIFETGDLVGLDVTCGALMALYEETRDPRWFPPLILRRKVAAGQLGRKTGRGWYGYADEAKTKP